MNFNDPELRKKLSNEGDNVCTRPQKRREKRKGGEGGRNRNTEDIETVIGTG